MENGEIAALDREFRKVFRYMYRGSRSTIHISEDNDLYHVTEPSVCLESVVIQDPTKALHPKWWL